MFFKKKYKKNVKNDTVFLAEYTTRLNAIKVFVEDETLLAEINALQDTFLFTPVTSDAAAKSIRKAIEKRFDKLEKSVRSGDYDYEEVLSLLRNLKADVITHSSRVVHQ
ncbi:MAG: hypothetical protein IJW46_01265 [Clostridia bacterium]|nr:hypothetical protein [Clostridia bacterium]